MRDGRKRTRVLGGLAAAGLVATMAVSPGATAEPARAGAPKAATGTASIAYTREDSMTVDYTQGFAPPGRQAIVGDFVGPNNDVGHLEDILWYTPGAGGDALWRSNGDRTFTKTPISISGDYTPLVGYFAGDYWADILWYAPGSGQDVLWDFNEDGSITKTNYTIGGTYKPIVGSFTDDGREDIIWYAPGAAADSWWNFKESGFVTKPINVSGTFTPVVGNFAGSGSPTFDYVQDIIWYAPGTAADSLWNFQGAAGTITKTPLSINGTFTPVPGDFTHDGFNDVIWYAPGSGQDYLWNFTNATGARTVTPLTINGSYKPITGEIFEQGDHRTDVLWFGAGSKPDALWDFSNSAAFTSRPITLSGNQTPLLANLQRVQTECCSVSGADIIDRSL